MANINPEHDLERCIELFLSSQADFQSIAQIAAVDGLYSGFSGKEIKVPAIGVFCASSAEDELGINFICELEIKVISSPEEQDATTAHTARESEMRTLIRQPSLVEQINTAADLSASSALRINSWAPGVKVSRGTNELSDFISTFSATVEVYYIGE